MLYINFIRITLVLSLLISSHAWSMEFLSADKYFSRIFTPGQTPSTEKIFEVNKKIQIKGYDTHLIWPYCEDISDLTQMKLHIYRTSDSQKNDLPIFIALDNINYTHTDCDSYR